MTTVKKKKTTPKKPISRKSKNTKTKSKSILYGFIILISLLIATFVYWEFIIPPVVNKISFYNSIPKGYQSFGIDVSHHQGNIDWETLFKDEECDTIIRFVYCKATEGSTHIDTKWESNRSALNNLGIPNGAYHFFNPKSKPKPQAEHFLKHWKKREVDLPPVLDIETEGFSDDDLRAKMTIWLNEIEIKTGMRPIIYTSLHFFESKFVHFFPNHKFWIAAYSQEPGCMLDKRIINWQYSESGTLPGIEEKVDFNVSKIAY